MPVINLCKEFESELVGGIYKHELLKALRHEDSDVFRIQNGNILHIPSGKQIILGCAKEYFRPRDSYFRFGKHDRCSFVQRALGVRCQEEDCQSCYRQCLEHGLAIKPKKIRVAKDYFTN